MIKPLKQILLAVVGLTLLNFGIQGLYKGYIFYRYGIGGIATVVDQPEEIRRGEPHVITFRYDTESGPKTSVDVTRQFTDRGSYIQIVRVPEEQFPAVTFDGSLNNAFLAFMVAFAGAGMTGSGLVQLFKKPTTSNSKAKPPLRPTTTDNSPPAESPSAKEAPQNPPAPPTHA